MRTMIALLLPGLLLAGPVQAACDAADKKALRWLDHLSHSLRETSYQGVFSYQYGNSLQSQRITYMRISHSVSNNMETEQLTRLSGSGARVVRTGHRLDCVHPGHQLIRMAALHAQGDAECGVAGHYKLRMGAPRRVAGREAVMLHVLPRDMYRYGYQMALDAETGLLLKTLTVAQDGKVLERFQFADLHIGPVDNAATPVDLVHHAAHKRERPDTRAGASALPWQLGWLPEGFVLTGGDADSVFDKTFTDGFAVFTVFVEAMPGLSGPGEGRARRGGTTAYTRGLALGGQPVLVTVLGEVPINTARMVADSVRWSAADAD